MKEIQDSNTMKSRREKWYEKRARLIFAWLGLFYIGHTPTNWESGTGYPGKCFIVKQIFQMSSREYEMYGKQCTNMYVDNKD